MLTFSNPIDQGLMLNFSKNGDPMLASNVSQTRIRALAFDVYDTIVQITDDQQVFHFLREVLQQAGKTLTHQDLLGLMSCEVSTLDLPAFFGAEVPEHQLVELRNKIEQEIRSIRPFADAVSTMTRLKQQGYQIAVCSNLSVPYAPPIQKLFEGLVDVFVWSFEAGAVKPEPRIYQVLCEKLGCLPGEILMVGDSLQADHNGPRKAGIHGYHLVREGESPASAQVGSLSEVLTVLAVLKGLC